MVSICDPSSEKGITIVLLFIRLLCKTGAKEVLLKCVLPHDTVSTVYAIIMCLCVCVCVCHTLVLYPND